MSLLAAEPIARSALRLVLSVFLARVFVPSDFGEATLILLIFELLRTIALLGQEQLLVQKQEYSDARVLTALLTTLGIASTLAILGVWLSKHIAKLLEVPNAQSPLVFALIVLPVAAALSLFPALLRRKLNLRAVASIEFCSGVIVYPLVAIALHSHGVSALVGAAIAESVFRGGASLLISLRNGFFRPRIGSKETVSKDGSSVVASQLLSILALQGDYAVTGTILGPTALGHYTRAYQLGAVIPGVFQSVASALFFPLLARSNVSERAKLYESLTNLVIKATVPPALFVSLHAVDIVSVLYGATWMPIVPLLRLLASMIAIRSLITLQGISLQSQGHFSSLAIAQGAYAVLVLSASAIGTTFGTPGVAIGVLVAQVAFWGLLSAMDKRPGKRSLPLVASAFADRSFLAMLIVAVAASWVLDRQLSNPIIRLAIAAGLWFVLSARTTVSAWRRVQNVSPPSA